LGDISLSRSTRDARDLHFLGLAVRQLREQRRLSQDHLAAAAGLTSRRMQSLEAGRLDPDYMLLLALANALNVRAGALVIRAEELAQRGRESDEP
jgi:transcriptional regulator with XRE-family HTH domain